MRKALLSEILKLSVEERIRLVEAIWQSISQVPEAVALTPEQTAELDRRVRAYLVDPEAGSPWNEVKERVLSRS